MNTLDTGHELVAAGGGCMPAGLAWLGKGTRVQTQTQTQRSGIYVRWWLVASIGRERMQAAGVAADLPSPTINVDP